jgi:hypothetical protein
MRIFKARYYISLRWEEPKSLGFHMKLNEEGTRCEGLLGVYSTIWCLCYKTNKLKKRRNRMGGAGPVYIG